MSATNYSVIGRCSLCGGDVVLPVIWHGIHPPVPTCRECGAVRADTRRIIPMERPGAKLPKWSTENNDG